MKVAHITSVHPRYDIRIFVKECVTLAHNGHEVTLIVADGKGDEQKNGVQIRDVGYYARGNRLVRMILASCKLFLAVKRLAPNVVHFHDPELIIIGLFLKIIGIRVIYDAHEDVPSQILSKHWLPRWCRPLVSQIIRWLENYAAKRFDAVVIPVSYHGKGNLYRRLSACNPLTTVVRNYPLLSELPQISPWESRKNTVCYVGSISKLRGLGIVVDALPTAQARLQLAGSWSERDFRSTLMKEAGWDWVDELGVLNRSEIVALLGTVKIGLVTILPTPAYLQALPIKLFEYMAAGLPVIASDFPMWREIVEENQCGLLVDPKDPQAIALAIRDLLNHDDKARNMGEAGRQAVVEHYNWEAESKKLLNLYDQLSCVS